MTYENILVEKLEGRVGLLRLNRPRALNALSSALVGELMDALRQLDGDDAIGCIVITGNDRIFAAGADIKEMSTATPVEMLGIDLLDWTPLYKARKPVIAAVTGYALGGGCELAMACDMIVASDKAKFGQPEINLGIIPGAGGTQRLIRAVGKALAMEMILDGRQLSAEEAYQFGLVNRVVPAESYLDEALSLARSIAGRDPVAVQMAKEAINKAFEMTLAEGLAYEQRAFFLLFSTEDQQEGMQAFMEKRDAEWKGK
jgi:enoyl-CoA hydratase